MNEGKTVTEITWQRKMNPFEHTLAFIEQDGNRVKIISETMNEENVTTLF